MNKLTIATALSLVTLGAAATDLTFTLRSGLSGAVDFTDAGNFVEGVDQGAPGSGDLITFRSNAMSITLDSTNIGQVRDFQRFIMTKDTVITIDVEDDYTLNCAIGSAENRGTVVKRGAGNVTFTRVGSITPSTHLDYSYDYYAAFQVEAGAIYFPAATGGFVRQYFGRLTVAEDAVIFFDDWGSVYCNGGINGAGTISAGGLDTHDVQIFGKSDFSGRFTGYPKVYFGGITAVVSRVSNDYYNNTYLVNGASVFVSSISNGESGVSSVGNTGYPVYFYDNGGRIVYTGSGESAVRKLMLSDSKAEANRGASECDATLDGGPNGGLVLEEGSEIIPDSGHTNVQQPFVLAGDNAANPCVIRGRISQNYNRKVYPIIAKEGKGTWLVDTDIAYPGAWYIREGILGFRSIENAGINSAVGASTNRTAFTHSSAPAAVDSAFVLGGAGTTGGIRYYGTNLVFASTLPIALEGDGGLLVDAGAAPVRWNGITAATAGDKTLHLGGTLVGPNEVAGIADAPDRKISIVKEGSGTWTLNGSNTISGTIAVEGGRLVVANRASTQYTWYDFVVRGNYNASVDNVRISEIALLDSSDGWVSKNFTVVTNGIARLDAGEATVGGHGAVTGMDSFYKLFNGRYHDAVLSNPYDSLDAKHHRFSPDEPAGWLSILMRLPANSSPITHYDVMSIYYPGSSVNNKKSIVRNWTLKGSIDGIHWDELSVRDWTDGQLAEALTGTYTWFSGLAQNDGPSRTAFPIAGSASAAIPFTVMDGVSSVSVAAGAELVCEGAAATVKGISVDAAGAGTLANFALAAGGSFAVTGYDESLSGDFVLPGTYTDVTGMSNVSDWTLSVNGVDVSAQGVYTLRAANGGFILNHRRPPLVLIVR